MTDSATLLYMQDRFSSIDRRFRLFLIEPIPYSYDFTHQDVKIVPARAVIGNGDLQDIPAPDDGSRRDGDTLFLQLDEDLPVHRI